MAKERRERFNLHTKLFVMLSGVQSPEMGLLKHCLCEIMSLGHYSDKIFHLLVLAVDISNF